ncbi:MAG: hypothetical protein WBZ04_12670 [Candidatus Nanopelagicales bacterium]
MSDQHQEPSRDWVEVISPDEDRRHRRFADTIVDIQAKVDRKSGPGRAFHRKQVLAARAVFEVNSDVSSAAAHGLFAEMGTYDAIVRLSNGSIVAQRDAIPDVRGFALSVRGLDAPSALGGTTDRQDFLLINRPVFGFRTSQEFAEIVPVSAQGQTALIKYFVSRYGPWKGPLEAAKLTKDFLKPFSGFATATFHSAAPIRVGPYAARVRLSSRQDGVSLAAQLDFSNDVRQRLKDGDLEYDLALQFYVNETDTPIEDGTVDWSTEVSPYVNVARVVLPQQDVESPAGIELAEAVELDAFDPWAAFAEHQPLGEIMRARKVAYYASQQQRAADAADDA